MINLLEGTPGGGKSYEALVYHILPTLRSGRKVVTNLPLIRDAFEFLYPELMPLLDIRTENLPILGRWDAEAANRGERAFVVGEFDVDERYDLPILHDGRPYIPAPTGCRLFGSVWDFYDEWRGKGNIGPLYVIDECHVSFPKPRIGRGGGGTPDEIIQWFKISRHFGADVLLLTQRMGSLDDDISALAEFHVRVRNAGFLGKDDHYIRKVFAGFRGGEVSTEQRKYETQYFRLYKSHTQGSTVKQSSAKDVSPAHIKWHRFSWVFVFLSLLTLVYIGFNAFGKKENPKPDVFKTFNLHPPETAPGTAPEPAPAAPAAPGTAPGTAPEPAPEPAPGTALETALASDQAKKPDPFHGYQVHLTGCMAFQGKEKICTLAISQNGYPIFNITTHDLTGYGYKFEHLGDCAAYLVFAGQRRSVVCDIPSVGLTVANANRKN